jgi:hypothetical protein
VFSFAAMFYVLVCARSSVKFAVVQRVVSRQVSFRQCSSWQTITLKNHHNKYGSAYRSDGRRSQVNPTMPIYTPPYYSLQSPKLAQI